MTPEEFLKAAEAGDEKVKGKKVYSYCWLGGDSCDFIKGGLRSFFHFIKKVYSYCVLSAVLSLTLTRTLTCHRHAHGAAYRTLTLTRTLTCHRHAHGPA
jgi:hypothetical protein